MANLKPVEPELIGRVRGAQRDTRFIPTDDGSGLRDAARGAQQVSQAIGRAVDAFAVLNKKREDAEYSKAMLDAEAEADRRYQDEVLSQKGVSAAGAYDRQQTIFREVLDKHLPDVPSRRRSEFSLQWQRRSNSFGWNSMNFEAQQLDASYVQTEKARLQGAAADFVAAGGDTSTASLRWDDAKQAFSNAYARTNGSLVDTDKLKEAERALKEEGVLLVPARRRRDGSVADEQRLKVVDGEPKEGEISRSEAKRIIGRLRERSDAYQQAWSDQSDSMVTRVVDTFIKQKDIQGATKYISEARNKGWVSDSRATALNQQVAEVAEVRLDEVGAESIVSEVVNFSGDFDVSSTRSEGGSPVLHNGAQVSADRDSMKYGSPEQDARFAAALTKIRNAYSDNPVKRDRIIAMAKMRYSEIKQGQKARYNADVSAYYAKLIGSRQPYSSLISTAKTDTSLSPRVRAEVLGMIEKRRDADEAEQSSNPMFLAEQESKLAIFRLALANGGGPLEANGVRRYFDLRKPDDLRMYVGLMGFSSKNANRVAECITLSEQKVNAAEVADVLGDLLEIPGQEALERYPQILNILDAMKGSAPVKTDRKWIKDNLVWVLSQKVSNSNWLWDTGDKLGNYVKSSVQPSEIYFNDAQFRALQSGIHQKRSIYTGGQSATQDRKPGDAAQSLGLNVESGSTYYFGKGKGK